VIVLGLTIAVVIGIVILFIWIRKDRRKTVTDSAASTKPGIPQNWLYPGDDLDEKQLAFKNPESPVSCNGYDFEPIKGKTTPV